MEGMPPNHPSVAVIVNDLQAYLDKAVNLGGTARVQPTEIPGGFGSLPYSMTSLAIAYHSSSPLSRNRGNGWIGRNTVHWSPPRGCQSRNCHTYRANLNLKVKVLDFVQCGGPEWTVDGTVFEMWLGTPSAD